jgi:hypothetical protein
VIEARSFRGRPIAGNSDPLLILRDNMQQLPRRCNCLLRFLASKSRCKQTKLLHEGKRISFTGGKLDRPGLRRRRLGGGPWHAQRMENQLIRVVQFAGSDSNFVRVIDALVPSDTPILVADQAAAMFAAPNRRDNDCCERLGHPRTRLCPSGILVYQRCIAGGAALGVLCAPEKWTAVSKITSVCDPLWGPAPPREGKGLHSRMQNVFEKRRLADGDLRSRKKKSHLRYKELTGG